MFSEILLSYFIFLNIVSFRSLDIFSMSDLNSLSSNFKIYSSSRTVAVDFSFFFFFTAYGLYLSFFPS